MHISECKPEPGQERPTGTSLIQPGHLVAKIEEDQIGENLQKMGGEILMEFLHHKTSSLYFFTSLVRLFARSRF